MVLVWHWLVLVWHWLVLVWHWLVLVWYWLVLVWCQFGAHWYLWFGTGCEGNLPRRKARVSGRYHHGQLEAGWHYGPVSSSFLIDAVEWGGRFSNLPNTDIGADETPGPKEKSDLTRILLLYQFGGVGSSLVLGLVLVGTSLVLVWYWLVLA